MHGRLGLALVLVLFGAIPATAFADDGFEGLAWGKRLLRGAMLTPAQVQQVRQLRAAQAAQEKSLQRDIEQLERQFDDTFTQPGALDEQKLFSLAKQLAALHAESDRGKVEVLIQIRALLTPEQRDRVHATHQTASELEDELHGLDPTIASEADR